MTKKPFTFLAIALALPVSIAAAESAELWLKHCKKCHGADGSGDTRMGKKLKAQNYTDPAVQAAMTDEAMTQAILEGRNNEAGKRLMAPFAEKLTPEEVTAIVAYVRAMKKE